MEIKYLWDAPHTREKREKRERVSMADTSFFFTNFPEHFMERDLWKVFQRWGRVLDVFVSRKLNARNRKFGFVRFQGVNDVFSLEREFDAIWIGTWKLQVNLPKYHRKDGPRKQRNEEARLEWSPKTNTTFPREAWNVKGKQTKQFSFAQVVSDSVVKNGVGENVSSSQGDEKVTQITVELEQESWLEGSYVGCFKEFPCMQLIKESFVMGGFSLVNVRYLGGSFALLSCVERGSLQKIIADNRTWFDEVFSSVTPWDGSFASKERFAWIRCRGIPLQLWCNQSFHKVGAVVGEVVEIDEATEKREVLEFARFRVKLLVSTVVNLVKEFSINDCVCKVTFEEEMSFPELCLGRWVGGGSEVDTEESSDEGSLGASVCDSVDSGIGVAGDGGVGDAGEGRPGVEVEVTVQGKLGLSCLGKEHKLHEGLVQEPLRGSLVHDTFSGSKTKKVEPILNGDLALSNKTVAVEEEKAGRAAVAENVDERVIKGNKNDPIGAFPMWLERLQCTRRALMARSKLDVGPLLF